MTTSRYLSISPPPLSLPPAALTNGSLNLYLDKPPDPITYRSFLFRHLKPDYAVTLHLELFIETSL